MTIRNNILLILVAVLCSSHCFAEQFDSITAESSTYRILATYGGGNVTQGSGFLVNKAGYLATNHHVVESANEVYVIQRQGETIKVWEASIHAVDSSLDLAILNVQGIIGKPVVFATEHPLKASEVFAVGFPAQADDAEERSLFFSALSKAGFSDLPSDPAYNGYVSASVKAGSVEELRERKWGSRGDTAWVITHNANITGGNSGGPLFDLGGRLVGVNTMIKGEGTSKDGILVGTILRRSSLYVELAQFLDRLGIIYPTELAEDDSEEPKPPSEPALVEPQDSATSDKTERKVEEFEFLDFSNKGVILLIGGGGVAAATLLIFLATNRRKGASAGQMVPLASQPPLAGNYEESSHKDTPNPDKDWLRYGRSQPSEEINPRKRRSAPISDEPVVCKLASTGESLLEMKIEITENQAKQGYVLGRSSSATCQIKHSSISRIHARISSSSQGIYITDLGSSNGTLHNKIRVKPKTGVLLQRGDTIQLGDIMLRIDLV